METKFGTKTGKLRKDYLYLDNPNKSSNRQKNINKGLTGIVNFCNKHNVDYSIRAKRKSFYFTIRGLSFRLADHGRRNNIREVDDNGKMVVYDFDNTVENNVENILPTLYKELTEVIETMFKKLSYVDFFNYINSKDIKVVNVDKVKNLKNFINEKKIKLKEKVN